MISAKVPEPPENFMHASMTQGLIILGLTLNIIWWRVPDDPKSDGFAFSFVLFIFTFSRCIYSALCQLVLHLVRVLVRKWFVGSRSGYARGYWQWSQTHCECRLPSLFLPKWQNYSCEHGGGQFLLGVTESPPRCKSPPFQLVVIVEAPLPQ